MSILAKINGLEACPCCSGNTYGECCQAFHQSQNFPDTAEKLMRSRFSAFSLQLEDYLIKTWHETTRPGVIEFTQGMKWVSLVINGRKKGRKKDREGWVTFNAYYELNSTQNHLHEKSYFVKNEKGHWLYVDGEIKN